MSHGFRKAFVNLFRCLRQNNQTKRRVSVGGYAPSATNNITTHLHPFNNEHEQGNNSLGLFNHSNSENFDLSRQHSYRTKGKVCNESDGDFGEKK